MSEWKREDENPAPYDTPVLIFDGEDMAVARKRKYPDPDHEMWWVNNAYGHAEDGSIPQVYFWMELPPKPKMPPEIDENATEIAGELE